MNLILSPEADRDLEKVAIYLGEHSPKAAFRFVRAVERTLAMIAALPEIAPLFRHQVGQLKGVRRFQVKGFKQYLVFYRVEADHVAIARVLHAAQDLRSILEEG